jgi:O-Antigen ligase/Tetratricopeptide repeat
METPADTARVAGEPFYRARNAAPYAAAMAAVAAFSFLSGGYVIGRSTPVAVALLVAAAAWVWFLRRSSPPPVLFLAGLCVFGAFTVWSGLSVLWSFGPDLTWVSFNLSAFYLAVAAVLGLTSVRGLQLWTVAYGYLAVGAAIGVYAFLGKALPAVVTHAHTYARLDSPVGYWNVLALMMVMGVCIAVAVAGDRSTSAVLRTLAAAAAVPMCFAFFFTFSRGGWLALAVALVLYFAFTTTRLASFLSLVAVVTPVGLVLWHLRGLETLFAVTADDALRALQGGVLLRWAAAALLVTAGAQLVVALLHRTVRWPRWSAISAGAVILAVVALVVIGGSGRYVHARGGVPWVKDRWHALVTDADTESTGNAVGRLTTLTTNGRIGLWREAARQSRYAREAGTGAGTFPFAHYRFRDGGGVVKHAHSQWFNVLSELGVIGLGFFVAAIVLMLAAMVGNPFAYRRDPFHPLLVSLQAGVIAFIVHMSWDWDWDMAAVGTLAFVFIAACVSYRSTRRADVRRAERRAARVTGGGDAGVAVEEPRGAELDAVPDERAAGEDDAPAAPEAEGGGDALQAPPRRSRRVGWAPRAVASAALVLLAVSWLPPFVAQRAENAALAAASEGDVTTALDHARRAEMWDPLAVSPLLTQATLLQQLGKNREALERLQAAVKLQPQNFEVWYELGVLQHGALGRDKAARASFARALALNPADAASRYELELLAD